MPLFSKTLLSKATKSALKMTVPISNSPSTSKPTKIYSALDSTIEFSSLEDGAFEVKGPTSWVAESKAELRANNCIGIPTETVYGLAANALDEHAVRSIYATKGRPSDNPLIVHVSSMRMLRSLYHLPEALASMPFLGTNNTALEGTALHSSLANAEAADKANGGSGEWPEIPSVYHPILHAFWPGPLTIILPRPKCIPMCVLGGHGDTVAFRFPSHPVARAIISAAGVPIAAPSANASGRPSPTRADHVMHDLGGRLKVIVDAGASDVGVESTVLDAFSRTAYNENGELAPCILRPGGVTFEQLRALGGVWSRLRVYKKDFSNKDLEANPTTPGMKYRHYSPNAPVTLFVPNGKSSDEVCARVSSDAREFLSSNEGTIGVVCVGHCEGLGDRAVVHCVEGPKQLAYAIFALLRELDESGAVRIFVQGVEDDDEGLAVMNRLGKAASDHVLV